MMIRFTRSVITVLLVLCGIFGTVYAEPVPQKIAVLDMMLINEKSTAVRHINSQIRNIREKLYKESLSKKETLDKKRAELTNKKDTLSEADLDKGLEAWAHEIDQYNVSVEEKNNRLVEAIDKANNKFNNAVLDIAAGIVQERKYDMLLNNTVIVYSANNDNNITNDVISKLNKTLEKNRY